MPRKDKIDCIAESTSIRQYTLFLRRLPIRIRILILRMNLSIERNVPSDVSVPVSAPRSANQKLLPYLDVSHGWEIGVDEAGRGPLFGRLYVAAVILPKGPPFQHEKMKDSKKFHSEKKIKETAEYIRENAIAWHVHYIDEGTIDHINIRQSVLRAMHECCRQCIRQIVEKDSLVRPAEDVFLLIDGNDFIPYTYFEETLSDIREIPHQTIEGGDNLYTPIAAASILAKVARDEYIVELCSRFPELDRKYQISRNKGYGTKHHLDGIREHGITQWHRKSFGICRTAPLCEMPGDG